MGSALPSHYSEALLDKRPTERVPVHWENWRPLPLNVYCLHSLEARSTGFCGFRGGSIGSYFLFSTEN